MRSGPEEVLQAPLAEVPQLRPLRQPYPAPVPGGMRQEGLLAVPDREQARHAVYRRAEVVPTPLSSTVPVCSAILTLITNPSSHVSPKRARWAASAAARAVGSIGEGGAEGITNGLEDVAVVGSNDATPGSRRGAPGLSPSPPRRAPTALVEPSMSVNRKVMGTRGWAAHCVRRLHLLSQGHYNSAQ